MAPTTVVAASRLSPALGDAKACSAQVLTFGATKPPIAPSELISAIPPAAAAPPRYAVGKLQNTGCTAMKPAAAKHSAISATSGEAALTDTAMPAAETASTTSAINACWPLRSARRGTKYAATNAQTQGMAVTKPTSSPTFLP